MSDKQTTVGGDSRRPYLTPFFLQCIIDSIYSPIFSVDENYIYTSFNKGHAAAMKSIYGVDIEFGKSILDYMSVEEDRATAKANLDRALRGESFIEEAYSGDTKFSRHYFEVRHTPLKDETGTVYGVSVCAKDVTERKQALNAVQASDSKLQAAINILPVGLWIIDAEGQIITSSAAAQRIWGGGTLR
ncbi:MAG: PAS domain-containing protein [Candidatus Altiarchaeota archaeon]